MRRAILALCIIVVAACAGANRAATVAVVTAEARTHAALVAANENVNRLCDGNTSEECRIVRLTLADLHDTAAAFARSVLAGRWDAFIKFVNDAAHTIEHIRKLPPSDLREALIQNVQRAVPGFGGTP